MSLSLTSVSLSYRDGDAMTKVLDSIDLHVANGQFSAVVGPSGSGKSSLLAVLGALTKPSAGIVEIEGVDLTNLNRSQRTNFRANNIGFLFQRSNLLPSLTATDQLLAATRFVPRAVRSTAEQCDHLLRRLGLGDKVGRRPHQLSGGERQRVGLGRAMINNPNVLLIDEPTSALDSVSGRQITEVIAQITAEQNIATIMITHDRQILNLVDDVVELRDGHLAKTLKPAACSCF